MPPARFHSFAELVLDVFEPALQGVRSEQRYELRSTGDGAQVWRISRICNVVGACATDSALLGWLTSRQIIELLEDLERSGVYELDPVLDGRSVDPETPLVSIGLRGTHGDRQIVERAPADARSVRSALEAIRAAIAKAQERALAWAG